MIDIEKNLFNSKDDYKHPCRIERWLYELSH